jgi:hypothetical protein
MSMGSVDTVLYCVYGVPKVSTETRESDKQNNNFRAVEDH